MQLFKINSKISIACEASNTRSGFKHEAMLMIGGRELDWAKCTYLNRTWKRFTYESVMLKLIEKTTWLDEKQKKACLKKIKAMGY